jgi:phosphate-selective porin OprO/OprP
MTHAYARSRAREYFWFTLVLMLLSAASAARAATPDDGAPSATAPQKKPLTHKKPTVEELEQRIQLLEQRLEAQQQATSAALQSPTAAQTAQQSPAQHAVTEQQAASATVSSPQIFAGPGGFSFQSADGANQIRFHGEFDFDGRYYDDNLTPDGSRSTWLLRRARPIVEGTFANIFDFRFNPDFAGGKTVIQDAFVAARFNPLFVVTAGKFKEPFGLERLQLSPNNEFIELGLPSDLVPNRDLGIQVSGTWAFNSGTLTYQVGYFNGVVDGVSTDSNPTPDVDNNDKKDLVARVFTQPFLTSGLPGLKGLGAGVAVSYVNEVGTPTNTLLPTYKTETQRSFFSYYAPATVSGTVSPNATIANGERLRISPQAFYYYRSFGLLSEYVGETQDVLRTLGAGATALTRRAALRPDTWQLLATCLVTGEDGSFDTVVPKRPFAVGQPGWGAVELAARVSELSLDSAAFTDVKGIVDSWFADPDAQASKAVAGTLGVNWYLTQNVEWVLNYTTTRFDGGAKDGRDRADERAFFTRFQVAF